MHTQIENYDWKVMESQAIYSTARGCGFIGHKRLQQMRHRNFVSGCHESSFVIFGT